MTIACINDKLLQITVNLLLNTGDLDELQKTTLKKYKDNNDFQKLLMLKDFHEIPFMLDYYRLVELRFEKLKAQRKNRENLTAFSEFLLKDTQVLMGLFFNKKVKENEENSLQLGEILNSFDENNLWSKKLQLNTQKPLTTKQDIQTIYSLCQNLAKTPQDADKIFVSFFSYLVKAKEKMKQTIIDQGISLEEKLENLPDNWYKEPWYYLYVQYFGVDDDQQGTFLTLKKQLDYLENLGIYNIYILPHYESPQGDAGYDISAYTPSKQLGGFDQYQQFLQEAINRGFRVATDLVFNHTSVEHKWFKRAVNGHPRYFNYYLKCPASWEFIDLKDILKDEQGDLFLYLKEKNKFAEEVISKRILIFPDVDKTLWLSKKVELLSKNVLFYREFYPFQVDLDLQNPEVIDELFRLLVQELSSGITGKRTDAIAHWVKQPGTQAKNLAPTYALQKLIKLFIVHVSSKAIILPEVVTSTEELKKYAGEPVIINNKKTTSSGDALLDFQLQGMLREMIYFQKTTPFWNKIVIEANRDPNNTSVHLLPIEHHDETYMGFIDEIEAMREYITGKNIPGPEYKINRGIIYKNGMSAGARYANCLNNNTIRITNAFFCLYMMPATPVIYYGTEIGEENNYIQMEKRKFEQFETFQKLLGKSNPITLEECEDPRELQRGPISEKKFQQAIDNKFPAIKVIKHLNQLRKNYSAFGSYIYDNLNPGNLDIGVLAMVKYPENKSQKPLIAISNLTECKKEISYHVDFLKEKLKINQMKILKSIFSLKSYGLNDIRVNEPEEYIYENDYHFHISLNPYSSYIFVVDESV